MSGEIDDLLNRDNLQVYLPESAITGSSISDLARTVSPLTMVQQSIPDRSSSEQRKSQSDDSKDQDAAKFKFSSYNKFSVFNNSSSSGDD